MKKSIFIDGSICYGIDYSNRPDCLSVEEISQEQYIEETTPKEEKIEQEVIIWD